MTKGPGNAFTGLFRDFESVASMGIQAASLILPLILFRAVWTTAGNETLVAYEGLVSLYGFLTICVEWGTGFLVTAEDSVRSNLRGLYLTIVRFRLRNWVICSLALAALALWDPDRRALYLLTSISLLSSAISAEYAFLFWGRMHQYQAISLMRPIVPLGFIMAGGDALIGFAVGSLLIGGLQFGFLAFRTRGATWSRIPGAALGRQYGPVALNDAATAVFSQLDAYVVGRLLPPAEAVIYLTIRKLVRAGLSVLNYPYRILYNRLVQKADALSGGLWIVIYSVVALLVFYLGWQELVQRVMGVTIDPEAAWTPVARGLGLLFVVGVVKGYLVHAFLLRLRMYRAYLVATLTTLAAAVGVGLTVDSWTAISATVVRLTPDILFVLVAWILWMLVRAGRIAVAQEQAP